MEQEFKCGNKLIEGITIDGILITDLLSEYRKNKELPKD